MAMRFIHALFDLPWWTGLPIFFLCNLLVPVGMYGYIGGSIGCLFGAWIFSKLISYVTSKDGSAPVIVCLPIFFGSMYFFANNNIGYYTGHNLSYEALFVVRTVIGLMASLTAFEGFKYTN